MALKTKIGEDEKFIYYTVNINGKDVRAYEAKDGSGSGFDLNDLAIAKGYTSVDQLKEAHPEIPIESKKGLNIQDPSNLNTVRSSQSSGSWREWAGINGAIEKPLDIVFWAGGSLDEAVEGTAPITFLANGQASFGKGAHIFYADGSASLANGKLNYDSSGNLKTEGTLESNKNGNRIVVDSESRSIKMYDKHNEVVLDIAFYENGDNTGADVHYYSFNESREINSAMRILGGNMTMYNGDIDRSNQMFHIGMVGDTGILEFNIDKDALPSSRSNASVGGVYSDGETLKIRKSN